MCPWTLERKKPIAVRSVRRRTAQAARLGRSLMWVCRCSRCRRNIARAGKCSCIGSRSIRRPLLLVSHSLPHHPNPTHCSWTGTLDPGRSDLYTLRQTIHYLLLSSIDDIAHSYHTASPEGSKAALRRLLAVGGSLLVAEVLDRIAAQTNLSIVASEPPSICDDIRIIVRSPIALLLFLRHT